MPVPDTRNMDQWPFDADTNKAVRDDVDRFGVGAIAINDDWLHNRPIDSVVLLDGQGHPYEDRFRKKYEAAVRDKLRKGFSGDRSKVGSRGGVVIGWTPSGYPLYKHDFKTFQGHVTPNKKHMRDMIKNGNYSIVSAGRNSKDKREKYMSPNHQEFKKRHEALRAELDRRGHAYTEVEGNYDGREKSFVVYHHHQAKPKQNPAMLVHHKDDNPGTYREMRELGAMFNQDSIIHSHKGQQEMHFTTGQYAGQHYKGTGFNIIPEADNYYTEVEHPKSKTKYSLNFDMDNYHPAEKALFKSEPRLVIDLRQS